MSNPKPLDLDRKGGFHELCKARILGEFENNRGTWYEPKIMGPLIYGPPKQDPFFTKNSHLWVKGSCRLPRTASIAGQAPGQVHFKYFSLAYSQSCAYRCRSIDIHTGVNTNPDADNDTDIEIDADTVYIDIHSIVRIYACIYICIYIKYAYIYIYIHISRETYIGSAYLRPLSGLRPGQICYTPAVQLV